MTGKELLTLDDIYTLVHSKKTVGFKIYSRIYVEVKTPNIRGGRNDIREVFYEFEDGVGKRKCLLLNNNEIPVNPMFDGFSHTKNFIGELRYGNYHDYDVVDEYTQLYENPIDMWDEINERRRLKVLEEFC